MNEENFLKKEAFIMKDSIVPLIMQKIMSRKYKFKFPIFPYNSYFLRSVPCPHRKLCSANDKFLCRTLAIEILL